MLMIIIVSHEVNDVKEAVISLLFVVFFFFFAVAVCIWARELLIRLIDYSR